MSDPQFKVALRKPGKPGSTKAYADVQLIFPNGEIDLIGFAIINQSGQKPFVGFPQNRGRNKYFPVVEAKGEIREEIVRAILRAYHNQEEDRE